MSLHLIPCGRDVPHDFNVIIEIPAMSDPVKYEVDKESGALHVDRFMMVAMHYPCNYGYIPNTLGDDGDPLDVLVITPYPLYPGVVVRCRALGVLNMDDEGGGDAKIIAVPIKKICSLYDNINTLDDLPSIQRQQIQHFFERYKDLEVGKWVRITGWGNPQDAADIIQKGIAAIQKPV